MTRRLVLLLAPFALLGCPHDWSAFEAVPSTADGGSPAPATMPTLPAGSDAPPAVFATLAERPVLVAADADGIVLTTVQGSVVACTHASCAPLATIASAQKDVRGLATSGGFVAWGARGDKEVRRASRTPGSAAVQEAYEDDGITAVALSPSKVYFAVDAIGIPFGAPGIRSCIPGDSCGDITYDSFADGLVTEMLVEGGDAFWLGENRVLGCPLATCEGQPSKRSVLADEPVATSALAVDGREVFYASSLDGGSLRFVPRAALAGGGVPQTLASKVGTVTRIAVTERSVWATNAAGGTVVRASRTGGPAVVVASGLASPTGIAAAGGKVYVACAGDGRVLRWEEP